METLNTRFNDSTTNLHQMSDNKPVDQSRPYHDLMVTSVNKLEMLIKEHKESSIYETCTHHVVPMPGRENMFMLYDKTNTKDPVYYGFRRKVIKCLRLRKIQANQVYNHAILGEIKRHERKDWADESAPEQTAADDYLDYLSEQW